MPEHDPDFDPDDARVIVGIPGYRVDSLGRLWTCKPRGVHRRDQERLTWARKEILIREGVPYASLQQKNGTPTTRTMARLVLSAYDRPANRCEVPEHIDGNPLNCRRENLRWKPRNGPKPNRAKLDAGKAKEIREKREQGFSITELANEYDVCRATIVRVLNGKAWKEQ